MKALIYRRVSTSYNRQDVERQRKPIEDFCERKGLEIIGDYHDDVSGTVAVEKRTGYSEMLEFIKSYPDKKSLNIVFDEVSRVGRTKTIIFQALSHFTDNKINVHFVSPEVTLLNPNGSVNEAADMIITLFSQLAESERNRIIDRVNTSLPRTLAKKRTLGGKPLYGYTVNQSKELIVKTGEAEVVREIFDLYIKGNGCGKIASILNLNNIPSPTGTKWCASTLLKTIKNQQYIGKRVVKGAEYEIHPIVEDDVFHKAQKIISDKANNTNRERKIINPLVSIGYCTCGNKLFVGKDGNRPIYKCVSYLRASQKCDEFSTVDFRRVNNTVLTFFNELIGSSNQEDVRQLVEGLIAERSNIQNVEIPLLKLQLNKSEQKIERVKDDYYNIEISKIERDNRIQRIKDNDELVNKKKETYIERINVIEKQILALNNSVSIDKIIDLSSFKSFTQKYIKEFKIKRLKHFPEITNIKKYFTNKKEVLFQVEITSILDNKLTYIFGNYSDVIFWKIYDGTKSSENDSVKMIESFDVENYIDIEYNSVGKSETVHYWLLRYQDVLQS